MKPTSFGAFLTARRAAVSPETLPFVSTGTRRVPGLRRDEVAMLAGVSVDYYTRLEQGRERNPSQQVVDALSRALELTQDQTRHLYDLADLRWDPAWNVTHQPPDPTLLLMMNSWERSAAFIIDPLLDIVEKNRVATALLEPFRTTSNLAEMVFLDPAGRTFFEDWDRAAESSVASLRSTERLSSNPARRTELVERLTDAPEFATRWKRYDVAPKTRESKELRHPSAGRIVINFFTFHVAHQPGYELVVYQAEPGSLSEERLIELTRSAPVSSPESVDL
jgi:transcriptional regulator with XRE-family HTH domain